MKGKEVLEALQTHIDVCLSCAEKEYYETEDKDRIKVVLAFKDSLSNFKKYLTYPDDFYTEDRSGMFGFKDNIRIKYFDKVFDLLASISNVAESGHMETEVFRHLVSEAKKTISAIYFNNNADENSQLSV